ncbi:MAG: ABC transporter permease [Mariprofundales bacterium]
MLDKRVYLAIACILPICSFCLLAFLQHIYSGQDGYKVELDAILQAASWLHPLGCDPLGRDVLQRLAEGVLLSIGVGAAVISLAGIIGISIGLFSAWFGGWVDALLMRIADVFLAFPGILLAIALAAMLGPGMDKLLLALVAVGWVGFARLARAQALSLRQTPFIQASIACGSSLPYIAWKHLLPNIAAPLLIEATFGIAAVMIAEAGLSFLGIGVQAPAASLGSMIREGSRFMLVEPSLVFWPGISLFLLVMSVNLLGDVWRDKLDVRL